MPEHHVDSTAHKSQADKLWDENCAMHRQLDAWRAVWKRDGDCLAKIAEELHRFAAAFRSAEPSADAMDAAALRERLAAVEAERDAYAKRAYEAARDLAAVREFMTLNPNALGVKLKAALEEIERLKAASERSYRRGCYQAVHRLIRDLSGRDMNDRVTRAAEWEMALAAARNSDDAAYLGRYLDEVVARLGAAYPAATKQEA